MSQSQPQQSTSLFRTSLRDWQANYKARQTPPTSDQPAEPPVLLTPSGKPRVKRLVAHKLRKQRQGAKARG